MCISVIQIFDNAFGPLEAFFAESPSGIESHHGAEVLQLFTFLSTSLRDILRASNAKFVCIFEVEQHIRQQCDYVHRES